MLYLILPYREWILHIPNTFNSYYLIDIFE